MLHNYGVKPKSMIVKNSKSNGLYERMNFSFMRNATFTKISHTQRINSEKGNKQDIQYG